MPEATLRMATVNLEASFVARISASHELRDVFSWRTDFQAIGPPDRKIMAPLILRNLKRGRGIDTLLDSISDLRTPASIAVRSELVRIRRLGSHCILISLCIGGSREVEVSVNGSFVGGCETDTIIMRRMDAMEKV